MSTILNTLRIERDQSRINKDVFKRDKLSFMISIIEGYAKDNKIESISDEEIIKVMEAEVKKTNKALDDFIRSDRQDLIFKTKEELNLFESYLPKKMNENEIEEFIRKELMELGIETPMKKDKGVIMKNIMPKLKDKADGRIINNVVTRILQ